MGRIWITLPDGRIYINDVGSPEVSDAPAAAFEAQVLQRWGTLIAHESARTGVPRSIIAAFIWAESAGNPNAKGGIGEAGLMQLSPGPLWRGHTEAEMMEPARNIAYGADLLAQLAAKYGRDLPKMASAYNCGAPYPRDDWSLYPWGLCEATLKAADGSLAPSHYIDKIVAMHNYTITHHPEGAGVVAVGASSASSTGAMLALSALAYAFRKWWL